jgi:hypothetical protein
MAPEIRSKGGMLPGCREGVSPQGRTRASGDGRKVMSGYPSWHMLLCGDDAHTIGIRIVVGKCANSAESNLFE